VFPRHDTRQTSSAPDRRTRARHLGHALAFVVAAIVVIAATGPVAALGAGLLGLQHIPMWTFAGVCSLLLLATSAIALRLERTSLADLGLAFTRRRVAEMGLGFVVGVTLFALLTLVRVGGVAGAAGLLTALLLLLPEELLFRGVAFQRLIAAIGAWPAILVSAALFGAYHAIGSQMWAMGLFFQIAMPALGGVVFGWAAVRTRGLALPIGLHLGGNWVQSSLLTLRPLHDSAPAGPWTARLSDAQFQALHAPDLQVHLPYIVTILAIAFLVHVSVTRAAPAPGHR